MKMLFHAFELDGINDEWAPDVRIERRDAKPEVRGIDKRLVVKNDGFGSVMFEGDVDDIECDLNMDGDFGFGNAVFRLWIEVYWIK